MKFPVDICPFCRKVGVRYGNVAGAEKYVGDDALDLLILFPAGTAWEVHFDVSVR